MKAEVEIVIKHIYILFPFIRYTRLNDIALLNLFGFEAYKRAGKSQSLFGYVWSSK